MRINDLLLPKYANVNVDDGAVPSPLFPSPQFAQASRDVATGGPNGPRSPWPPGFQPPPSAHLALAAAAQAAQASGGGNGGEGITSPLSPWGFPNGQHSPVHLVHMAAANAAAANASLSPEHKIISGPTVRLGPVPSAVHPMSAHVQQAGQLTGASASVTQEQQQQQQQQGQEDLSTTASQVSPQMSKMVQVPLQPNAAPAPLSLTSSGASASASVLASHARQPQHPSPLVLTHMPTPRSTPPVHQQTAQQPQGQQHHQQPQPEARDHRDRSAMSQHPGSNASEHPPQHPHPLPMYNHPLPPVPLMTASGLPLGWHPTQAYPPLATMPFQTQQNLATLGGTPATSGATTPNMDDAALAGRPRAGSAPPPGGRRGSARPGGAPMLDLPQPRNEGSPAPHPAHHPAHMDSHSGSSNSASPGPFMSASSSQQPHPSYHPAAMAHHHHGRSSYSAVGPHASAYDPHLGGAPGSHMATPPSAHSAAAALQPLVDPSHPGMHSAMHVPHAGVPAPPMPMAPTRMSRIPVMDDDVVVLHTTDNMQRPFACIHCGRAFWRRYDCKRHMRVHTDERPYACSGCDRTFARKDALNRHLQAAGCAAGIAAQAAQLRGAGVDPVQAVAAAASANAAASAVRNGVGGVVPATTQYHQQTVPPQNHHHQQQPQAHHQPQQQQQHQQQHQQEEQRQEHEQQHTGDQSQPHSPTSNPPPTEVMPATTVADLPVPMQGAWRASARSAGRGTISSRGRGRTATSRPLHLNIQPHAVQQQQMAMLAAAAAAAAAAGSPVTLSHPASATSLHSPVHLVQPSPIAQQFQQVEMTAAAVMAAGVLSPVLATMPVVDATAAPVGMLAATGLMSPTHVVPSTPTVASMPVDMHAEEPQATAGGSPVHSAVSSQVSAGGSPTLPTNQSS